MRNGLNAFLWLALLAVFARALLPAGFMPGDKSGGYSLTICAGMTTKTIFVPVDKQGAPGHAEKDICPFALPVLAEKTPEFFVASYIPAAYEISLAVAAVENSFSLHSPKPWFSQGPPSALQA